MTHPGTTPDDLGPSSPPPSEAATWLQARLDGPGAERLARYLRRARTGARILTALALVIGVAGLLLGLLVWGSTTEGIVVVVLLSIPGVIGPVMLARRVTALVRAVAHPDQVATQARDLVGQVRSSPELDQLVTSLGGLRGEAGPGTGRGMGRFGKGLRVARLGSQVVGQAKPDRSRHPLLMAFTPDRLGSLWRWFWVSLWGAPLSAFLAFAALVTLLLRQV